MTFKEFFKPNIYRLLFAIPFIVLFVFFPILSKSIFAVPFFNLASTILSAITNIIIAFIFSCLLVNTFRTKKFIVVVVIIVLLFLLVPKVVTFSIGDITGATYDYCECRGYEWNFGMCCGSNVHYCIGLCQRNEAITHWPGGLSYSGIVNGTP